MMKSKLNWNGEKALAEVEAKGWEQVLRTAVFYWQKCVEAVGISNPRPYKTPAIRPDPPRKRTGFGQRNIAYEANEKEGWVKVGVKKNAVYMAFLQAKGWDWLLSTLKKHWATIKALAGG